MKEWGQMTNFPKTLEGKYTTLYSTALWQLPCWSVKSHWVCADAASTPHPGGFFQAEGMWTAFLHSRGMTSGCQWLILADSPQCKASFPINYFLSLFSPLWAASGSDSVSDFVRRGHCGQLLGAFSLLVHPFLRGIPTSPLKPGSTGRSPPHRAGCVTQA